MKENPISTFFIIPSTREKIVQNNGNQTSKKNIRKKKKIISENLIGSTLKKTFVKILMSLNCVV